MLDQPSTDFKWTDEAVATLKDHWLAGLSCSQIAAEMGQGLTRNSIIGKVTRLKLPKRTQTMPRAQRSALGRIGRTAIKPPHGNRGQPKVNAIVANASRPSKPLPPAEDRISGSVQLLDLTNHTCRWPVGEATGSQQQFCGAYASVNEGKPYCDRHTHKAEYQR